MFIHVFPTAGHSHFLVWLQEGPTAHKPQILMFCPSKMKFVDSNSRTTNYNHNYFRISPELYPNRPMRTVLGQGFPPYQAHPLISRNEAEPPARAWGPPFTGLPRMVTPRAAHEWESEEGVSDINSLYRSSLPAGTVSHLYPPPHLTQKSQSVHGLSSYTATSSHSQPL